MTVSVAKDTDSIIRFRFLHADLEPSSFLEVGVALTVLWKPALKSVDQKITLSGPIANECNYYANF